RVSTHPACCAQWAGRGGGHPGTPRSGRSAGETNPGSSAIIPSERSAMTEPVMSFVGIWSVIIATGVFLYVVLDGFDLGIGILHGFSPSAADGDVMMKSIAPVWDGNETWLVLGGLALLTAFPLAFAIIIPAVYFPILIMLVALAFRGVAFEFRFQDPASRAFWDHAFHYGSIVATFAQGLVLGAFIQGFRVEGRMFAGGAF